MAQLMKYFLYIVYFAHSAARNTKLHTMKKALRETQTLAVVTAKFNQLEIVTTFTYKPSLLNIDARNFELSW